MVYFNFESYTINMSEVNTKFSLMGDPAKKISFTTHMFARKTRFRKWLFGITSRNKPARKKPVLHYSNPIARCKGSHLDHSSYQPHLHVGASCWITDEALPSRLRNQADSHSYKSCQIYLTSER